MSHPLASLVGPLRYACQRDFAQLHTVKGLRPVVERALEAASGLPPAAVSEMRALLAHVDDPRPDQRKVALRQLVGALRNSGLALPAELEAVALVVGRSARPAGGDGAPGARPEASLAAPSRASADPRSGADASRSAPPQRPHRDGEVAASQPHPQGGAASAPPQPRTQGGAVSAPPQSRPQGGAGVAPPQPRAQGGAGVAPPQPRAQSGAAPAQPSSRPALEAAWVERTRTRPTTWEPQPLQPLAAPPRRPPPPAAAGPALPLSVRADVPRPDEAPPEGFDRKRPRQDALLTGDAKKPRKRKAAKGQQEARAEARLLSIAPRSGPLSAPLKEAGKRINPRLVATLNRKGLRRLGDVLFLLPRCYEDRRRISTIAELVPGERGVTVGLVRSAQDVPIRGGRKYFRAVLADATGSIAATYFQSGPWLKARFPLGKRLLVSGEVRASAAGREMAHPEIEPAEDLDNGGAESVHFGRVVPVYPGFERGEQRTFRELAARVAAQYADALEEPLPEGLRRRLDLVTLPEALRSIHAPDAEADLFALDQHLSPGHRRLAFDELFFLQLGVGLKRQGVKAEPGIAFDTSPARLERARAALPFTLTGAQTRVVGDIAQDMAHPEPMNRLVQGDVGSGKTAVAAVAALVALQDGYQVAVMAPTEILAEQHERTFRRLLEPLGFKVGLVSASGTAKHKRAVRDAVARGELHVAVGTHALFEREVGFAKLGLAVIDEQHRFGVLQRRALMSKGTHPDVLVMTATPIPRTLAMTLYGDLDVSVIDELPPGRTPIVTRVYPDTARARVYEAVGSEIAKGHQAYVVYPLVEESEKVDLEDATQGVEKLAGVFPHARVGLLHGRMKPEEKDAVMDAFRAREVDILVATTVVEVGVDVPNASVMVIEAAERFGLSQLHQLRGRVGRGAAQSFCFLVANRAQSPEASERLAVMERSSDGFVIAEKDLELRGPGEFLGTRQSGMPELAVANLARDADLLALAQAEARRILAADPRLEAPEHQGLVRALEERWEGRLALARVG